MGRLNGCTYYDLQKILAVYKHVILHGLLVSLPSAVSSTSFSVSLTKISSMEQAVRPYEATPSATFCSSSCSKS